MIDYVNEKTDSLRILSIGLTAELSDLACKLEDLVKSPNHVRNPDLWSRPKIPNDHYDEDMANEAIVFATKIYNIVKEQVDEA